MNTIVKQALETLLKNIFPLLLLIALFIMNERYTNAKVDLAIVNKDMAALNQEIEKQRYNYEKKVKEFDDLKKKPPDVKYKTVYKTLYKTVYKDRNITTGDCDAIKQGLDAFSTVNYNDL